MDKFDKIYNELMKDLRWLIMNEFGSLEKFCRENGLNRSNLSCVFNGKQTMSVGLYLKIASSLNAVGLPPTVFSNLYHLSLKEYLQAPHDAIRNSLLLVHFEVGK